ncbi:MAG: hypothetical protein WB783_19955 [Arenicellales bacterium]
MSSQRRSPKVRGYRAGQYPRYSPNLSSTLAVAAAGPPLVLIAFTVPLTTLMSTAKALGVGAGLQAWIMSGMSVGAASGLLSRGR